MRRVLSSQPAAAAGALVLLSLVTVGACTYRDEVDPLVAAMTPLAEIVRGQRVARERLGRFVSLQELGPGGMGLIDADVAAGRFSPSFMQAAIGLEHSVGRYAVRIDVFRVNGVKAGTLHVDETCVVRASTDGAMPAIDEMFRSISNSLRSECPWANQKAKDKP